MSYGVVRGIKQGNEAYSPENTVCLPRMEPSYEPEGSAERWEVTKHKVILGNLETAAPGGKTKCREAKGTLFMGNGIEVRMEQGPQWPGGWR